MTILKIIKQAVCYNQGELAQYSYLASIFHRSLKEQYQKDPSDKKRISFLLNNLTEYLNRNLKRISTMNFELLQLYFHGRSEAGPRICLKGEYGGNIVEIFRESKVNYVTEYEVDSNTGFKDVRDTGKYFFCNDIPLKAKIGEYINPRLDAKKVSQYSARPFLNLLRLKGKPSSDNDWLDCWVRQSTNTTSTESSCYKSTLIVPMTLWNNSLSDTFKELINISNIERSIFGFLCFDHQEINYFNEDQDVNIGYIFADLLSLYFIHQLNYTDISNTFTSVKNLMAAQ